MQTAVADQPGLQGSCSAEGVGTESCVNQPEVGLAVTFFLLLEGIGCKTNSLDQSFSSLGLLYKEHLKSSFAM